MFFKPFFCRDFLLSLIITYHKIPLLPITNRASLTTHTRGPGQHSHAPPSISFIPFHSPPLIKGKGKGRYSSSWEPHLRATGCHLPHGITVLPATRHKWTCST